MDHICDYNLCTGCFTCQNVCPKDCITLLPDKHGELHPIVNQELCIDCEACKTCCPVNNKIVKTRIISSCYAACVGNRVDRQLSSSGGIASLMYKYFIEVKKGLYMELLGTKD